MATSSCNSWLSKKSEIAEEMCERISERFQTPRRIQSWPHKVRNSILWDNHCPCSAKATKRVLTRPWSDKSKKWTGLSVISRIYDSLGHVSTLQPVIPCPNVDFQLSCNLVRAFVKDFQSHGEFSRGLTKLEAPFCETIIVYEVLGDQARIDIGHEVTKVKGGQV